MTAPWRHDLFLCHSTRANLADEEELVFAVERILLRRKYRAYIYKGSRKSKDDTLFEEEFHASRGAVVFYDSWSMQSAFLQYEMTLLRERRAIGVMKPCIVMREPGIKPPPGFDLSEILPYIEGETASQLVDRIVEHFKGWLS